MRGELIAIVTLLAILLLGWLGYTLVFGRGGEADLVVQSVNGTVTRLRADGRSAAAQAGESLEREDRIAAGEDGRAVLAFGPQMRVTVAPGAEIAVVDVTAEGVRLELEGGEVQATVRPGSGTLGIGADGRLFEAEDADLRMVRADDGTVAAENTRGVVRFGVEGATQELRAGERVVAPRGGSPLTAAASEALLLSVQWPSRRLRAKEATITGRTEPGALVKVGREGAWVSVRAGPDGTFTAHTTLEEGSNDVQVVATSVLGSVGSSSGVLERDTTPPVLGVEIH